MSDPQDVLYELHSMVGGIAAEQRRQGADIAEIKQHLRMQNGRIKDLEVARKVEAALAEDAKRRKSWRNRLKWIGITALVTASCGSFVTALVTIII